MLQIGLAVVLSGTTLFSDGEKEPGRGTESTVSVGSE